MKIRVALFTRDRFPHVRLCSEWLTQSQDVHGVHFRFKVYDDGSTVPDLLSYLEHTYDDVKRVRHPEEYDGNARIGASRQLAIDEFMADGTEEYLLLLDSDMLTNKQSIADAAADYGEMRANPVTPAGLYTMHAQGHLVHRWSSGGSEFSTVGLTGEASMFLHQDDLVVVGNHFGPHYKGFGDTQIRACEAAGMYYGTRINPEYQIQHLGWGDKGSTIFADSTRPPPWVQRPFRRHYGAQMPLVVPGFDLVYYEQCVRHAGGALAPRIYLEQKGVTPCT